MSVVGKILSEPAVYFVKTQLTAGGFQYSLSRSKVKINYWIFDSFGFEAAREH